MRRGRQITSLQTESDAGQVNTILGTHLLSITKHFPRISKNLFPNFFNLLHDSPLSTLFQQPTKTCVMCCADVQERVATKIGERSEQRERQRRRREGRGGGGERGGTDKVRNTWMRSEGTAQRGRARAAGKKDEEWKITWSN
mmetsp:Transcript_6776/g.23830  ORF Transcript_6776/g.23830 Transcript_6776/m.23830 type:complete len:142 (+) Transcript_6776:87-512(+)